MHLPADRSVPWARLRRSAPVAISALAALSLSSCSTEVAQVWMPSTPDTTNHTGRIIDLWVGSWIAAMAVGVLVWGLIIWCVVVFRRRRDETGFPAQVKYNLPIEIMYTVIPLMMIGVLFYYTARDQAAIASTEAKPDIEIGVVGKQWSWDFNYVSQDGESIGVYETGVQGQLDGTEAVEDELPTLWLPVDQRVEFTLTARDVAHSFWIPAFLYKMDAIPGIVNTFQVVPTKVGTYRGKCAELCGEYHSEMLFNVKVVTQAEFDAHMEELRQMGNVGELDTNLGRVTTPAGGATPGRTTTEEGAEN